MVSSLQARPLGSCSTHRKNQGCAAPPPPSPRLLVRGFRGTKGTTSRAWEMVAKILRLELMISKIYMDKQIASICTSSLLIDYSYTAYIHTQRLLSTKNIF